MRTSSHQPAPIDVAFVGGEAILGGDFFAFLWPQGWNHRTETRAIGPDPVAEDSACMDVFSLNIG
jgi:hypothetical protein